MPIRKYRPFLDTNPADLPDRQWPSKRITKTLRWMSTDLRDGNQALIEPMDPTRKRRMFDLLIKLGYKGIEIGFPATSQTDYNFMRSLIKDDAVPKDMTISVLTQSRSELIERTVETMVGFPRATAHLYNATAPVLRKVVLHADKAQTIEFAQSGAREIIMQAEKCLGDETIFGFEYSPEIFMDTKLDLALEVYRSIMDVWEPGEGHEIVLNLLSAVERSTPNVFADQIRWMSRNLSRREYVVLSVHPHNDRGTSVATAGLALLAGADRIEGCLLGQGERTGNVGLVTLGLSLSSQGIDPGIDFSDVDAIRRTVEYCTQMETLPYAPYIGDLVYMSFSGSHQDAIKKGFTAREAKVDAAGDDEEAIVWGLSYLLIDPYDVGRSYEAVVHVNSQPGKGGVAYFMLTAHALELPRRLQVEFSRIMQRRTDTYGGEINAATLQQIFADEYLPMSAAPGLEPWSRFEMRSSRVSSIDDEHVELNATLTDGSETVKAQATGTGPIDASVSALHEFDLDVRILDCSEHAVSQDRDTRAAAYVEATVDGQIVWGVGIDSSITRASYEAAISAVNRVLR